MPCLKRIWLIQQEASRSDPSLNASGASRHNCRWGMVYAQRRPWKGALLWTSEVLQLWDPWETWQGTPDSEGRPSLPSWYLELLARASRSWAEEPERITVGMNRETLPAQDHLEITGWDPEGMAGGSVMYKPSAQETFEQVPQAYCNHETLPVLGLVRSGETWIMFTQLPS